MDNTTLGKEMLQDAERLAERWRLHGRWRDALALLRGVQPLAKEQGETALARNALLMARVLNDEASFGAVDNRAEREPLLDELLALALASGDLALLGAAWDVKGRALHNAYLDSDRSQEPEDELAYFERGLALRREANDPYGIAESLFHVGLVYGVVRQDHERALPYFEESYQLAQQIGDDVMASYAVRHIAFAHYAADDLPAAHAALVESLQLREATEWQPGVAMACIALAHAEAEFGDKATAVTLFERAKGILESLGATRHVEMVERELANLNSAD